MTGVWLGILLLAPPAQADLGSVRAEPNPERRAEKALANAMAALKAAQDAYRDGQIERTRTALQELGDSVVLAYDSLAGTGKNPRRSPKHFKRAEIRTRELLRRLDDFRQQMSVEDRDMVDPVRARIQTVHEQLLAGIMEGKKK